MNIIRPILVAMWSILLLNGCVPRIEISTPKDPITINMNVKIEHEIRIKADEDIEGLLRKRSNLFDEAR